MPERDYYDILGLSRDANAEQIKKAYRTLARKYHPDVNPGDKQAEQRFKEVQQAYDILGDSEKRTRFDRFGHAAFEGVDPTGPHAGAAEWSARHAGADFETIDFSQFFGGAGGQAEVGGGFFDELLGRVRGGRRPTSARPGRSIEAHLSIPFLTAVRGGETTIAIARGDDQTERLTVKIPPGTEPGAKLRLKGRGEPASRGGAAGDLLIEVSVEPHPYFQRDGRDLTVEVPITVSEAILGTTIEVPTLEGLKALTVPPGTSSGQKLRLRGQGVPSTAAKPAGDLYVVPKIMVPRSVDDEGRRLIRAFAERHPQRPRDGLWPGA